MDNDDCPSRVDREAYLAAIDAGDTQGLKALLDRRPRLVEERCGPSYAPDRDLGCTGLHRAVHARQPGCARALLDAGIDVEAATTEGRTALHDSIELGAETVTELLLERGARVDVCSAAILGRIERLRELLDADPDLANDRSTELSPLGWAAFGNRVDSATELLDRGARMDDFELLCAASVGHVDVGRLLIERGADPNAISPDAGGNALHAAVSMRYTDDATEFVAMLLEHGADPSLRTTSGRTALELAENGARAQTEAQALEPALRVRNYEGVAALLRDHIRGKS